MKKFAVLLTLILVCTALTACGGEEDVPESSSDAAAAVGIVSGAEETGTPAETGSDPSTEPEATRAGSSAQQESPAQGEQTPVYVPKEYSSYTTQDLWCNNGGKRIYGKMYLPEGAPSPMPAVILSHSFSLTHESMNSYCIALTRKGYAAYCFDFCGGSKNSRSDGDTTDMTVFTEVSDLEAVLAHMRSLSYIDRDNIFLLGTSQGGLVSALAAAEHPTEVKGLILMYPGFSMPEQITSFFKDPDNISDMMLNMFAMTGMPVGRGYVKTLHGFDVYANIKNYSRDVLILHGSRDFIVPISYSERAVEVYPHATLRVIEGAGHGFNSENMSIGGDFDGVVLPYVYEYLQAHTN